MTTMTAPRTAAPTLLRRALLADALVSGGTGALMALGAAPLGGLLGMPPALLFWAGASLLPFAAILLYAGTRELISRRVAWGVVLCNGLWVLGSVLLLATPWVEPTLLGYAFTIAQAVIVAVFAELQYFGIRRS